MGYLQELIESKVVVVDGVKIFNVTPHEINFQNKKEELVMVPPSGVIVNATPHEEVIRFDPETECHFVRTFFEKDKDNEEVINEIHKWDSDVVIVGSIIAAQAYPGQVVAMTPIRGFERKPLEEKRMNPLKFTTFEVPE